SGDGRYLGDRIPWKGTAGDLFLQVQFPLHSGRIAGLPGRIFISAMGLLVALLSATGVIIWWQKRSASILVARRAVRAATPPMTATRHPGTTMMLSTLACALAFGAQTPALAQSAPQTIAGVVQDEQGARVPGAMVTVKAGTLTRETHADADG